MAGIRKFFDLEARNVDDTCGSEREDSNDDSCDGNDSFIDNDSESIPPQQKQKTLKRLIKNKKVGAKKLVKTKTAAPTLSSPKKEKLPGDISFPVSSWSLTITKNKDDVPLIVLEIMYEFIQQYCLKGAVSTEVGPRAHHYHIQGMMTLHYPTTPPFKKSFSKANLYIAT